MTATVDKFRLFSWAAFIPDDIVKQVEDEISSQNDEHHVRYVLVGIVDFPLDHVQSIGEINDAKGDDKNEPSRIFDPFW